MRDRSYARYLAPLALVLVLVAGIVVVAASTGGDSKSSSEQSATAQKTPTKSGKRKKFYRVKPGQLLSDISEKTGVSVETIIKLNPDVDPQALQAGQLIRLRR
jgi:LysM repeat protein